VKKGATQTGERCLRILVISLALIVFAPSFRFIAGPPTLSPELRGQETPPIELLYSHLRTPNSELSSRSRLFSSLRTFHAELVHSAHALDVPPLKGYVNDYANMMSQPARAKIEEELRSFEKSDSTQIVILTVPSLEGEPLEDYAIKVAEAWKVGQKGKDNGIILLVANQDRKIRIEVGRGLEGNLTDLTAGRIIDLVIKPKFKRADFDGGFISGIHALVDATRGEFKGEEKPRRSQGRGHVPILALLIFGGVILSVLGKLSRVLGGLAGAVGFPLAAYLFMAPLGLITLILVAVAGLLMGIFLPLFGQGGGPFWGGYWGGGGGGGGDSGGFDGGGGDFGGGGASGDW
jgi:uncharacterized protein